MHRLDIGHHQLVGKKGLIHIGNDALFHLGGDIVIFFGHGPDGAVTVIVNGIERRHINALDGGSGLMQEGMAGISSLLLHADVKLGELHQIILSLANGEAVEKVCHRLRVIGAGATADDDGILLAARIGAQRDTPQQQHAQCGGIAHLIAKGDAEDIKIGDGVPRFVRPEWNIQLAHLFLHIYPRAEYALTPDIGVGVQRAVQKAHAEIGHADLVGVGKGEGEARLDLGFVFEYGTVLTARVAPGLFNGFENGADLFVHKDLTKMN